MPTEPVVHPGPDISVVIPARNAADTIVATLRSLKSEAALIAEIILVDDGSTDGTADAAGAEASRLGLPLRVLPAAVGDAGAARNIALDAVNGQRIYFIDADDHHIEGGLGALRSLLVAEPAAGIAVGAYIRNADGRKRQLKKPSIYSEDRRGNAARYLEDRLRSIAIGSALFDREAIGTTRFPEYLAYDEDTIFLARIIAGARLVRTDQAILVYNVVSSRSDDRFAASPRQSFLAWSRALAALAPVFVPHRSAKRRRGFVALKIARVHYARREFAVAHRFLSLASATPLDLWNRYRAFRYRLKIAALAGGERGKAAGAPQTARRPPPVAGGSGTIVLTIEPAWPPVSGADHRNWRNALAAKNAGPVWLVSLAALRAPEVSAEGVALRALSDAPARELYAPGRRTEHDLVFPDGSVERLWRLIEEVRPAAAIIEAISFHPFMPELRRRAGRLILDLHNIESDLLAQGRRLMSDLYGFRRNNVEALRAIERKAAAAADEIWVCSDVDSRRFAAIVGSAMPIRVLPNTIPRSDRLPNSLPPPISQADGPRLLFIGHLSYPPNIRAAETLARAIVPRLRTDLPRAALTIAGRSPANSVSRLARDGVDILADPPDVDGLLVAAHFAVMPLTAGGGTRIKAIEAMAWGVPVVATARAVEGLGLIDRKTVRLAETPRAFCRAIVELWNDPPACESQRLAAWRHARAEFCPAVIDAAVAAALCLPDIMARMGDPARPVP